MRHLLLIISCMMLASCAHVADLKSPTQIAKEEKRKAASAERRAEREAKRAERDRQMQERLAKEQHEQQTRQKMQINGAASQVTVP